MLQISLLCIKLRIEVQAAWPRGRTTTADASERTSQNLAPIWLPHCPACRTKKLGVSVLRRLTQKATPKCEAEKDRLTWIATISRMIAG